MSPVIKSVHGRAVAVPGDDIDTDRIMPARYLRCVTFQHIGQHTFQDERFDGRGNPRPHPLNDPKHAGASVLIVNKNFGCGSSREHAPQGILRWGFKAVVGESFAEIFGGNCTAIGLPVLTASPSDIQDLMTFSRAHPDAAVAIDLEKKEMTFGARRVPLDLRESARKMFLEGLWDSSATLFAAREQVKAAAARLPYLHDFAVTP